MKNKPPKCADIRRVIKHALELDRDRQLGRQNWQWIAQWINGDIDSKLPIISYYLNNVSNKGGKS